MPFGGIFHKKPPSTFNCYVVLVVCQIVVVVLFRLSSVLLSLSTMQDVGTLLHIRILE